jgi:two-component system sensor histidine kinase TctE
MTEILRKPSLRNRLLRHVLLPLAVTWLMGSALVVGIASYFAQQAFDRSLLDDAYLVASHVRRAVDAAGTLDLNLSAQEMNTVLFDQSESLYFAVLGPTGNLLAGHAGLRPEQFNATVKPQFAAMEYQGRMLRTVTIRRQEPGDFYVVMAQTTTSRDSLLQRLFTFSIVPQLLLLVLLAAWLQHAIEDDLTPLADLEEAVGQRDARDLTPVAVTATTRDVQRLGKAINALLGRIAYSVQAQREFSGNVAHELRTPLAGIRALADYGLRQTEPHVWREQLQGIAQSQERASHLVDQLLALALADEAKQTLKNVPVSLDDLVGESVLRFLSRADAAKVDLGAKGIDHAVTVLGNAALIEGILNNLIDNALRYGRATDGASHITVSLEQTYQNVTLSVIDNGVGVAAHKLTQISQRWVQGASGEALKAGMGLGLAIVGTYAKLLGAQVEFKAVAPKGFCVSVVFPQLHVAIKPEDAKS